MYVDGELLAVVVYRKGAVAIADMLVRMRLSHSFENVTRYSLPAGPESVMTLLP